jgi:multisubunit Na+/H+ antiporter MnhG subunit
LCNHSYIIIVNKILTTSIISLSVIVLMLAIANPVIALVVNQVAYPPNYDPDIDYTDKECAKMFPNFSEGYYDCTGGIPNPGP